MVQVMLLLVILVSSFEKTLAKIEADIASALAKGDDKKAADLKAQQEKTKELLSAAQSGASELK